MKTIQELYNEIMANKELKEQFIEAAKAGKQEAFLKEHGCEATLEEVKAFLEAKKNADAPLSFDKLENAAGGECNKTTGEETVISIFTVGFYCGIMALASAADSDSHMGQQNENDGRICSKNK